MRRKGTVRRPVAGANIRFSNAWPVIKLIIVIACVSVGVLVMILHGFPLIEDLIKGVDPSLRYQPKVEKEFSLKTGKSQPEKYEIKEMYISDIKTKNDPYIAGEKIIFTTRTDTEGVFRLDSVGIYDAATEAVTMLPNVEKKYDNLLNPLLSGNIAVWVDSMIDGGGRIVGYDLTTNQQFVIKEYGYAIPALSLDGDLLTFMQWAGDALQRFYVYNVRTREAVTVKLYETEIGNSATDVSASDIVWSEYKQESSGRVSGTLKRIVLEDGTSRYEHYNFGDNVFEPKTNGKDIVYATDKNITGGDLMLSVGGGQPVKIAENVLNYDLGDTFVAYTKDDKIHVCFTNQQKTLVLTSDIAKNLLVSTNGNGITFYDITDGVLVDEVVMYATIE